jgi:molybdopterin-guanine dinucleotide biosynthesis protein A
MMHLNLLDARAATVWDRLRHKVRKDRRSFGPLHGAVAAMREEQRADGIKRGVVMCDVPWCACSATHEWVRTLAEIKASRVKRAKVVQEMAPTSIRCETHVPDWRLAQYKALVVARVEAVA